MDRTCFSQETVKEIRTDELQVSKCFQRYQLHQELERRRKKKRKKFEGNAITWWHFIMTLRVLLHVCKSLQRCWPSWVKNKALTDFSSTCWSLFLSLSADCFATMALVRPCMRVGAISHISVFLDRRVGAFYLAVFGWFFAPANLWKPRKRITDLFHCRSWAKHPHV